MTVQASAHNFRNGPTAPILAPNCYVRYSPHRRPLAVMAGQRADYEPLQPVLGVIGKLFFIGEKPGMARR